MGRYLKSYSKQMKSWHNKMPYLYAKCRYHWAIKENIVKPICRYDSLVYTLYGCECTSFIIEFKEFIE